jgi:outer membrane protein OmpA-like peptidoglycan-associated protein
MNRFILFIILFFFSIENFYAQSDSLTGFRIGIFGGGNYVTNSSEIPVLPNNFNCGIYENGESQAYHGGLNISYELYKSYVLLDGRFIYDGRPAYLSVQTSDFEVYESQSDSYKPLVLDNKFDATLDYLIFDIGFKLKPFSKLPIYSRIAFDAGNPVFKNEFVNYQEIREPQNVLYPDETKIKIIENGAMGDAGTALGLSGGIGAEFRLRGGMLVSPELSYRYGLNSPVGDYEWQQNIFRFSLAVQWEIPKFKSKPPKRKDTVETPVIIKEPEPETLIVKTPEIKQLDISKINVKETVVTQTYPLLPYIFFDENSDELRSVYKSNDAFPDESVLEKNSIDIYYRTLDIVAVRMQNYPEIILTVTGYTDGKEKGNYTERLELAEKRAEKVVRYITSKYSISQDRFIIKTGAVPLLPSNTEYAQGYEENRRVELSSAGDLLKPVIHSKFIEFKISDNFIKVLLDYENPNEIDMIDLSLHDDKSIYFRKNYIEPVKSLDISLNNKIEKLLTLAQPQATLIIYSKGKIADKITIDLRVDSKIEKFELGRLNLIVFDYNKSEITETNRNMLSDFINSNIQENSEIKITGSTDKLGEANYNLQLSQDRANTIENYILQYKPGANITEVKGIGESNLLFDNNLPEGRFYCRTVLIEVKTPLKPE